MKLVTRRRLFGVLFAVLVLCGHGIAFANAAPPPTKLWFTFTYTSPELPTLEGVQLVICATAACDVPLYVQQYAVCDTAGCVLDLPEPPGQSTFACASDRCLVTNSYHYEQEFFQIIAQFADRTRTSAPLAGLPSTWDDDLAWSVQVQDADLAVNIDADFASPVQPLHPLLLGLVLTLGVELLIAATALWLLKREERASLAGRLLMVFLINLLTYPLVWLIFPASRQFQPQYLREISPYVGIAILVYAAALVWIYATRDKKRLIGIIVTVVSLPVIAICLLSVLVVAGYGSYKIAVPGLSPGLTLLFTEVFVVVAEAVLLYVLNRKTLSRTLVGALSLAMNLASFLVGQVVF